MKKIDFNKLIKNEDPKKIIRMHCNWQISLTDKQVQQVIDLKNQKERGFAREGN